MRGAMVDAQMVMFAFRGIELRGSDGQFHRMTYRDLSDSDAQYLLKLLETEPKLTPMLLYLKDRMPPQVAAGGNPGFSGPWLGQPIRPDLNPRPTFVVPDTGRMVQERAHRHIEQSRRELMQPQESPAYSAGKWTGIIFLVVLVIAVIREASMRK